MSRSMRGFARLHHLSARPKQQQQQPRRLRCRLCLPCRPRLPLLACCRRQLQRRLRHASAWLCANARSARRCVSLSVLVFVLS